MNFNQIIKEACETRYKQQPTSIKKLDSLTNFVFKLDFESLESVVIKIFNKEKVNLFLFRFKEMEAKIEKTNYFGDMKLFQNEVYLIERFIENEPITIESLRQHSTRLLVMKTLAKFHNLMSTEKKEEALIFDTWKTVFTGLRHQIFENFKDRPDLPQVKQILVHYDRFITQQLWSTPNYDEVTLCHNDLLGGNLLFNSKKQQFMLIDFEYAGFGSPFTDIYNLLIESTYHYDDNQFMDGYLQDTTAFPSDDELHEILKFYLFFRQFGHNFEHLPDNLNSLEIYRNSPYMHQITDSEIQKSFVKIFELGNVSNLYWSIFGFYIFKKQGNSFNYPNFGLQRYNDFLECAAKFDLLKK